MSRFVKHHSISFMQYCQNKERNIPPLFLRTTGITPSDFRVEKDKAPFPESSQEGSRCQIQQDGTFVFPSLLFSYREWGHLTLPDDLQA